MQEYLVEIYKENCEKHLHKLQDLFCCTGSSLCNSNVIGIVYTVSMMEISPTINDNISYFLLNLPQVIEEASRHSEIRSIFFTLSEGHAEL